MTMRVLITGSTTWTDTAVLTRELAVLPKGSAIVTGDTPGVDALASGIAIELGLGVELMKKSKADYKTHPGEGWKGLNERMLATGIDLVLAFHPDYGKPGCARGTQHVVDLAKAAGIEAHVFTQ
jgi:hypothetical protein